MSLVLPRWVSFAPGRTASRPSGVRAFRVRNSLASNEMVTRRQERVSERIHHEISDLLHNEIRDPRVAYVTVTDVEISPDLQLASVFVSTLGDREARDSAMAGLESASGYIRRELAQRLRMRVTPTVRFVPDESWERGTRLDALLDKVAGTPPLGLRPPGRTAPRADGASAPAAQQGELSSTTADDGTEEVLAEPDVGADLGGRHDESQ